MTSIPSPTPALQVDTPVVVLNTFHTGLAVGRNLGRLGVRVIGMTAYSEAYGNASRWIEYRPSPDSFTHPRELLSCLLELSAELGGRAILLPTRDHDINFVVDHWSVLEEKFLLPMLPPQQMRQLLNKDAVAAAARDAGIHVPRSVTVGAAAQIESAAQLRFPCICKPVYATQWRKDGIWDAVGRQKVRRVDSYDALEAFYRSFCHLDPLVSVQEWVAGDDRDLQIFGSHCSIDHEVTAFFTARKRLQYPRLAGTGIAVEALPLPELEQPSRDLLRRLRFRGVSEIEFKRDERDGRLFLIEVNPRHWDQHGLGTAVGVNLSEALYREATGQPARAMRQSSSRRLWLGDGELIGHVVQVLRGRAPAKDLSILLEPNKTPSVFSWKDPLPFLALLGLRVARQRITRVARPFPIGSRA